MKEYKQNKNKQRSKLRLAQTMSNDPRDTVGIRYEINDKGTNGMGWYMYICDCKIMNRKILYCSNLKKF